jgi:hypothetical protein
MLRDILHCVYATGNQIALIFTSNCILYQIALIFTSNCILCKIYLKPESGQAGTKNDNIVKTMICTTIGKILDTGCWIILIILVVCGHADL